MRRESARSEPIDVTAQWCRGAASDPGHRLLDNHPVLNDSHRIDVRAYTRLTENWGIGAFQLWELDDGTLEVQQYTLHRDFNHWVASMGITHRDNRLQDEFGVIFSFTLKDFPSASLPFKLDAQ